MGEPPSRNPLDYRSTQHLRQRMKYRSAPEIPNGMPADCIEHGTYIDSHPNLDAENAWFKLIREIRGRKHEFTLTVAPEPMVAKTICCFCHLEDVSCDPSRFHTRV